MALVLNEEQVMLREAASDFLSSRAPVSHLRQLRDSHEAAGFSADLWAEMVEMGWAAILIREGGVGQGGIAGCYAYIGFVIILLWREML